MSSALRNVSAVPGRVPKWVSMGDVGEMGASGGVCRSFSLFEWSSSVLRAGVVDRATGGVCGRWPRRLLNFRWATGAGG
jgi:hypothetical protein